MPVLPALGCVKAVTDRQPRVVLGNSVAAENSRILDAEAPRECSHRTLHYPLDPSLPPSGSVDVGVGVDEGEDEGEGEKDGHVVIEDGSWAW